jgi:hypothetical protein
VALVDRYHLSTIRRFLPIFRIQSTSSTCWILLLNLSLQNKLRNRFAKNYLFKINYAKLCINVLNNYYFRLTGQSSYSIFTFTYKLLDDLMYPLLANHLSLRVKIQDKIFKKWKQILVWKPLIRELRKLDRIYVLGKLWAWNQTRGMPRSHTLKLFMMERSKTIMRRVFRRLHTYKTSWHNYHRTITQDTVACASVIWKEVSVGFIFLFLFFF